MTNEAFGTLYIGVTNNLIRRVYEHKEKLIAGFTKRYGLDKLVYYELHDSIEAAITRLPPEEYRRLIDWILAQHQAQWDGQMDQDSAGGKLDSSRRTGCDRSTCNRGCHPAPAVLTPGTVPSSNALR